MAAGVPGGRDAPPTCRCATRWRCGRCWRCSRWSSTWPAAPTTPLDAEVAVDTLLSPIGGADAVGLRRLRRALRRVELENGGGRTSDELLAEALVVPGGADRAGARGATPRGGWPPPSPPGSRPPRGAMDDSGPVRRGGGSRVSAPSRCCGRCGPPPGSAPSGRRRPSAVVPAPRGPTATSTPWWGCSTPRRSSSTGCRRPGPRSSSPTSAARTSPATPSSPARPWASRSPSRRPRPPPVGSGTSSSWRACRKASGPTCGCGVRCWGRSTWSTSCRGGRSTFRAAQAAVRYDETRSFLVALTRASDRVIVTAVRSDDEQPSVYLDVVDPETIATQGDRPFAEVARTMTLPTLVGELRRQLVSDDRRCARTAVAALARLTHEGVPGADPGQWWVLRELSDDRPLRARRPGGAGLAEQGRVVRQLRAALAARLGRWRRPVRRRGRHRHARPRHRRRAR